MRTESAQITKKNRYTVGCLFTMDFLTIDLLKTLKSNFKLSFIEIEDIASITSQPEFDFILADASQLQTVATYNEQESWNATHLPLLLLLKEHETIPVKILTHPLVNKTVIVEHNNCDFGDTVKNAFLTVKKEFKVQELKIICANKKTEERTATFLENVHTVIKVKSETNHTSTEDIAAALSISPVTLRRRIKKHTGMTAVQYIRQYRLQIAKFLLGNEGYNVQETALKTGFMSHSYFTKSFKNTFGVSPSYYRIN